MLRLNTDGAVDTTFSGAGVYNRGTVYKVLSQPDGKVLITGLFNKINGIARKVIARLNADGSLDTGFVPPSLSGTGLTLALQPDGKILVSKDADGFTSVAFGDSNDVLVPADYDGDGKADIAVFRPSNGTWYLLQSQAGFTAIALGLGTDKPVPGDYNGDGRAEVAVFRPSNGY